jgi:hypothetical protein
VSTPSKAALEKAAEFDTASAKARLLALTDSPEDMDAFCSAMGAEYKHHTALKDKHDQSATVAAAYATRYMVWFEKFGTKDGQIKREDWARKYFGVGGSNVTRWQKAGDALAILGMDPKSKPFAALMQAGTTDVTKAVSEAAQAVENAEAATILQHPDADADTLADLVNVAKSAARIEGEKKVTDLVAQYVDLSTGDKYTAEERRLAAGGKPKSDQEKAEEKVRAALERAVDTMAEAADEHGVVPEGIDPEAILALFEAHIEAVHIGIRGVRAAIARQAEAKAKAEAEAAAKAEAEKAEAARMAAVETRVADAEKAEALETVDA